jgi:hypothetical protein
MVITWQSPRVSSRPRRITAIPTHRARRAAAATAALLVGVAACSSGDRLPDVVTSSSAVTSVSASTTSTTTAPTSTSSTSTSSTTTTTSTTLPPTTTSEPIVTEGGVVLVANASRVPGAAARLTTALADRGFTTNSPVNAAGSDEDLPTSRIYARDTSDPVALSISRLLGGIPVVRMPTPVPIESGSAGDATVVVMLGRDLATAL